MSIDLEEDVLIVDLHAEKVTHHKLDLQRRDAENVNRPQNGTIVDIVTRSIRLEMGDLQNVSQVKS